MVTVIRALNWPMVRSSDSQSGPLARVIIANTRRAASWQSWTSLACGVGLGSGSSGGRRSQPIPFANHIDSTKAIGWRQPAARAPARREGRRCRIMESSLMNASSPTSSWARLAAVAVWAIAFALVEAMVVVYLRRLFGLQDRLLFTPGAFHYPRAYLGYEQAREAATMVMLLGVGYLAGRAPALAVVARHARPVVPHPRRVVGAGLATGARVARIRRRRSADPGQDAARLSAPRLGTLPAAVLAGAGGRL